MAAVTIVGRTRRNVAGQRKTQEYSITGADTNTLDTPFKNVIATLVEPSTITAIARSVVNGKIRLTFSASAPFTAVELLVRATN
jgi:hypothetical protein